MVRARTRPPSVKETARKLHQFDRKNLRVANVPINFDDLTEEVQKRYLAEASDWIEGDLGELV